MLTTSIYNHLFKQGNHCYLFNSRNSFFAEIPKGLYEIIDNNDLRQLEENTLCELTEKGIVTKPSSRYNFYNEEKVRFLSRTYDKETLVLVLVPSTSCNFACSRLP